jgi:hypothetical protein
VKLHHFCNRVAVADATRIRGEVVSLNVYGKSFWPCMAEKLAWLLEQASGKLDVADKPE